MEFSAAAGVWSQRASGCVLYHGQMDLGLPAGRYLPMAVGGRAEPVVDGGRVDMRGGSFSSIRRATDADNVPLYRRRFGERTARHRPACGTVLVGQLAVMAFGVTDTIVAGRYRAGAGCVFGRLGGVHQRLRRAMGMPQALLPTWAELHGQRHEDVGRSVRQALYLGTGMLAGGLALLFPARCRAGPSSTGTA
jgi:hypothetical protein